MTASAIGGVLSAVLAKSFLNIIAGLIFSPIGGILLVSVFTLLFYYFILFVLKQEISIRSLYTLIYLASLPSQLLFTLNTIVPLIEIACALLASYLLWIGLQRNFNLPKKPIGLYTTALFAIYLIVWFSNSSVIKTNKRQIENFTTPESLDILEKEIKGQ
ncbi:MAG: hypothetical protein KDD50_03950 [Bdellovibrionales bacterium]|nr:hypothetical protein [Bdellovibrionales bacterium]